MIKRLGIQFGVIWVVVFVAYVVFALSVGAFDSDTLGWKRVLVLVAINATIISAFIALLVSVVVAVASAFRKPTDSSEDGNRPRSDNNEEGTSSSH